MKYAIIAAGEGSRLAQEGIQAPKPLVKVDGEHLIDRLIRIFIENDADEVLVICNNLSPLVREHLESIQTHGLYGKRVPLRLVVKTTPSSMHSFFELSEYLHNTPFILTTVDTIFKEKEFGLYVEQFEHAVAQGLDGVMGVTDYIDDEKPLYVATDGELNIEGFWDDNVKDFTYISGGIYGLTSSSILTLHSCMNRGESRMRNFQRGLIQDGRRLKAYPFSKVLDIDHATDIEKAEQFIHGEDTCDIAR